MPDRIVELPNGDSIILGQEDRRNIEFHITDLYKYVFVESGGEVYRSGKYVPKVNDKVFDYQLGYFRVSKVIDYVAELIKWELPKEPGTSGVEDILLGTGPGYTSETWVAYLDTTKFPHLLDIDSRMHVYGSEARTVIIYHGVNITSSGEIISAYYDQSGQYKGPEIPLEIVATVKLNNVAIKRPKMAYARRSLHNGELVTAVVYGVHNNILSINKLKIHRTNLVRSPDEGEKRIQSIELISPYLSKTNSDRLEVPVNTTTESMALRGKVTYSNGESMVMDIGDEDGDSKFRLLGLKYWSPSIMATPTEITLVYRLDKVGEIAYLQGEIVDGAITQTYKIVPLPVNPAYTLKVYAFPRWTTPITGWVLDYWLYDLERMVARRVPSGAIELTDGSQIYDGLDFTRLQRINIGVNLMAIDPEYGDHRHVQSFQVALLREGSQTGSKWRVKSSANQPEWYGEGLEARVKVSTGGLYTLDLINGAGSFEDWLDIMYYKLDPLHDSRNEVKAPVPTHIKIVTNQRTIEIPAAQWNTPITFINDLKQGETVYLQWVKRLANNDLQLGISGVPVVLI